MAKSGGPRIGRPDRLAALGERSAERFQGYRGLTGPSFLDRLLSGAAPEPEKTADQGKAATRPPAPSPPRVLHEPAAQLAELLEPLPSALDELATRISRHCGSTRGATTRRGTTHPDDALAQVVEAVRARTWELSCAVRRLAEAAGGGS